MALDLANHLFTTVILINNMKMFYMHPTFMFYMLPTFMFYMLPTFTFLSDRDYRSVL